MVTIQELQNFSAAAPAVEALAFSLREGLAWREAPSSVVKEVPLQLVVLPIVGIAGFEDGRR